MAADLDDECVHDAPTGTGSALIANAAIQQTGYVSGVSSFAKLQAALNANLAQHAAAAPGIVANNAAAWPGHTGSSPIMANAFETLHEIHFHLVRPGTPKPDVLYPLDFEFNTPILLFHLSVWMLSVEPSSDHMVVQFHGGTRFVSFLKRTARTRFERWWAAYTKQFDGKLGVSLLPSMRPGAIKGYAVQHENLLDGLIFDGTSANHAIIAIGSTDPLNLAVIEWGWIVRHAKARVCRIKGFWVFERRSDAAMFMLFRDEGRS